MLLLFMILNTSILLGQKTVFNESFDNAHLQNWQYNGTPPSYHKMKDGKLEIANNSSDYLNDCMHSFNIDGNKDFKLTTRYRLMGQTVGIYWATSDWTNSYKLELHSNKTVSIIKMVEKKESVWIRNLPCPSIKGNGLEEKVIIEKKNGQINFYVNDRKVFDHKAEPFAGNKFGFNVHSRERLKVTYFNLAYTKMGMNLVSEESFPNDREYLGNVVNSNLNEIAPVPSADGNTLYFCRRQYDKTDGFSYCNIWKTERNIKGEWSKPVEFGKPLNNDKWNTPVAVSQDGNSLIVEGKYRNDGSQLDNQGLSISHRVNGGWSVPKPIKIQGFYNNSKYFVFSVSPDQNVIVMSVLRNDTYGDFDLFVSFKQADGTYGTPKNMGVNINTYEHESSPWIAADNKTLYFSSRGWPGYGASDIFVAKRLDDTWTNWSTPKNLGPKVNSARGDWYFSVSAKGDYAYMISNERNQTSSINGYYVDDIYRIKLADEAQPDPIALIKGKIIDPATNKPVKAKILYKDAVTHKTIGEAQSDPETGEYTLALPVGKTYEMHAQSSGHKLVESQTVDLVDLKEYKEIEQTIEMHPIAEGSVFQLNTIKFAQNKAELLKSSFSELDELISMMNENPGMKIELSGHTETTGNPKYLLHLSEERVKAVKKYLTEKGIAANRISGQGYGGSKPLGKGYEYADKNRRVEVKILNLN